MNTPAFLIPFQSGMNPAHFVPYEVAEEEDRYPLPCASPPLLLPAPEPEPEE